MLKRCVLWILVILINVNCVSFKELFRRPLKRDKGEMGQTPEVIEKVPDKQTQDRRTIEKKPINNNSDKIKEVSAKPISPFAFSNSEEDSAVNDTVAKRPELPIPDSLMIEFLDLKNTDIRDVIRAISTNFRINVWMDASVKKTVSINFNNIKVKEAIEFLVLENGFDYTVDNSVIKIFKPVKIKKPTIDKVEKVIYDNGYLSFDLKNADLSNVVKKIAQLTGENIIVEQGVSGTLSGFFQNLLFKEAMEALMQNNGYRFKKVRNIYRIERDRWADERKSSNKGGRSFNVIVEDGLVSLDVFNASINNILEEISQQSGIDVFIYGRVDGQISAKCTRLTIDESLDYIFRGTDYIFSKKGEIYFVGKKDIKGITSVELIRLNHLKAEGILEQLPAVMTNKATLKIIKEHNGIIAIGPYDVITEIKDFIAQIDQPVAQVLIEAIVVDFKTDKIKNEGVEIFLKGSEDSTSTSIIRQFFPILNTVMDGQEANRNLRKLENYFDIKRIGRLPHTFFMMLNALEKKELAKVISRPQIATLNGHTASITVGQTQYFLLKKEATIPTSGTTTTQTTEEFQTIQADMSLRVTPWVSAAGEITTEINPSFNTPRQSLSPGVPPTIDRRELSSTVRLRDGETIILGGLIRTTEDETRSEFPLLGRIPYLGRLFRTESTSKHQSEMIVYLTPHLYYGGEGSVDIDDIR